MRLTFEPAVPQDADTIFQLSKDLIQRYEDLSAISYDRVTDWIHSKITNNIHSYTRVLLEEETAGYYRFVPSKGMMELDDLYILPPFQNQGIGTQIIRNCCNQSTLPIILYVFTENTRAMALYERMGFRISRTVSSTRCIMIREKL